jgi:hypothetical protein
MSFLLQRVKPSELYQIHVLESTTRLLFLLSSMIIKHGLQKSETNPESQLLRWYSWNQLHNLHEETKRLQKEPRHYYDELKMEFSGRSGRAVWGVGVGRVVAGIVGSNPAESMDVCPRLSVLCCPV